MSLRDFPLPYWFELLSFLICILLIRKLRSSSISLIIPILFLVFCVETVGMYLKYERGQQTAWLYNWLTIIQFPLWIMLFYFNIKRRDIKRISLVTMFVFIFFSISNVFFIQGYNVFNNYSLILGAASLILICCCYLLELLGAQLKINPLRDSMFWISAGSILYFTGTFLFFAFYGYLEKYQQETGSKIFNLINLNLIIVFYTCISIGLMFVKPTEKWKQQ